MTNPTSTEEPKTPAPIPAEDTKESQPEESTGTAKPTETEPDGQINDI